MYPDILFPVLKIVSGVNLTGHYCAKREGLKWRVVMGIIVHPVTKKLPHPQVGSNSKIGILSPKARQYWNAPPEEFETQWLMV